ncbi:MAG: tetratricopeptide repeat protein [Candidatus Accumulibacter sp.]|uniref:Putative PEP-CTERM system TPR-repeat lipoprotein n=2 Tax=Candidatus Accumulibacter TaxID=327159 RepID=A0A080M6V8_9PROT|nr:MULTISPECIES: tetratricopeptide repeat protein [Candidatus Accumulibacter]KFB76978.1 MAG: putative PEP-CTERM system TPR-repeat lipoprotein [Candidatus Accumulibacter cognatus]MBO3712977.1 tetratricopeptide repeat protein [Accumulibacter sp.]QLH48614.1 MAG: tetratricopeptide repeat protein [Candidatus Accumulibacter cognatus]
MSLLNQMLQDLDERRAAQGVDGILPNAVRPLPRSQSSRLPLLLGMLLLAFLAGGLAFHFWEVRQAAPFPSSGVPPFVPAPAAVTAASPPPLVPLVDEPPKNPEAGPAVPTGLAAMNGSPQRSAYFSEWLPAQQSEAKPPAASIVPETGFAADRSKVAAIEQALPAFSWLSPQGGARSARIPIIEKTDPFVSSPDRSETEYRKAIALLNQGALAEAMEGLHKVLRLDGSHSASRQVLVRLLLEATRPDEAVQVLQEGLLVQPEQVGWAMTLARLQIDRGDLASAWQTLHHSLPAAGNNADYQGVTAHVLQRLGRHKEAAEHYGVATRLAPGDGRWWLGLALALEAEGHSTEARDALHMAKAAGTLSAELTGWVDQKLR